MAETAKLPRRQVVPVIESPKKERKPQRKEIDNLSRWSNGYVALAAIMSMVLNAMANGSHAKSGHIIMAYIMGGLIPILVLLLGRIAGLLYRRKRLRLAYAIGSIGVVLLLLSVFHCTESISVLTGSNSFLAMSLAIGIDCGLVGCEIVSVIED